MILDDIKEVLGIYQIDTSRDNLLNIYIRKGVTLITNYMNAPVTDPPLDVSEVYIDALIEYVIECYRKKGNEGTKSFSQGSRSGTYEDGLSDSVKSLLPSPFIKMMGVYR